MTHTAPALITLPTPTAARFLLNVREAQPGGSLESPTGSASSGEPLIPDNGKTGQREKREYVCSLIAAGRVKRADQTPSKWLLPRDVLAGALDLFNARPCYLDHPERFGFGGLGFKPHHQEPRVKNLVGIIRDPEWNDRESAVLGTLRLYDRELGSPGHLVGVLLDQILEDKARGLDVPPLGLSAVFYHNTHLDEDTGLTVTDQIHYVESVDIVYDPGAAGYIRRALSAIGSPSHLNPSAPAKGAAPMTEQPVEYTLNPQPAPEPVPNTSRPAPEEVIRTAAAPDNPQPQELQPPHLKRLDALDDRLDSLEETLKGILQAVDDHAERNAVQGFETPGIRAMVTGMDQITQAFDALMGGVRPPSGIRPLSGIRELYTLLSGDYELSGRFQPDRVYLANVTSSTMAALVANALNKRVINTFQSYPKWWENAVTIEDFTSLQTVRWITLGGVGELPTVSEGAAYTELDWDDNTETASFVKKGGYLGITIEAIDKDDTRKLQAAPRALAQAAWLTLGKSISAIFTANTGTGPALADSTNLFDASRSNLGSAALSHAAWKATKIAMMKFTELNSGERLAALVKPHLLWVPVDLEETAIELLATGEGQVGSADYHLNPDALGDGLTRRIRSARERVITCPFWTDTNNWAAQADPRLYPSIGLGFRYGRQPEIYSVASPTAGLMFTNDTMPVKVRFFFAVGPTDYRGLYKHNVS